MRDLGATKKKEGASKRRASGEPDSKKDQKRGRDSSISSMTSEDSMSSGTRQLTIAARIYKGDPSRWEDLETEDWQYLEGQAPHTVEAFRHNTVEEFERRAESMSLRRWNEAVGGLLAYNQSSVLEAQVTAESRACKRCKPEVQRDAVNVSFAHRRFQWAVEEYTRRNVISLLDLKTAKTLTAEAVQRALEAETRALEMSARIIELKEEQKKLRARIRTLEEEREREKAVSVESPPVVTVEMETGEEDASPMEGVSPALVRTVETVLEQKWEQLCDQFLTQLERQERQRRAQNTSGTSATWAQAVGRKERSAPPPTGSVAPPQRGKRRVEPGNCLLKRRLERHHRPPKEESPTLRRRRREARGRRRRLGLLSPGPPRWWLIRSRAVSARERNL